MLGLMMNRPLLISAIARHADLQHPQREIVSVTHEQPRHRYTYREAFARARKLANALRRGGIEFGDRIATLAWNDYRHFEIYYGVSGSGLVCHTVNPRLFPAQVEYILNHATDRWLFLDPSFLPLVEQLAPRLTSVERYVILADAAHLPATSLPGAIGYEALLDAETDDFDWPDFDENTASSLCYTSGTTGDPKGVLFSHRSTLLHAFASALPDAHNLSARSVVMPVVPMFHVNAWGLPYCCVMVGAKLVLPGSKMGDPETLQALIAAENVDIAAGVPTVWQAMAAYLEKTGKRLGTLARVLCGGSAVPLALTNRYRDDFGVQLTQAWGMTETSPIATISSLSPEALGLSVERRETVRAKQGRAVFGIEVKVVDETGSPLPRDGKSFGAIKVRGAWVASGYFKREDTPVSEVDGWFDTGDVGTLCPLGYLQITDRTKDVIKSGGEWISSIDLENLAVAHPAVSQAAVIAVAHPRWQERPLLVVVLKPGAVASREELLEFYLGKVARWWIPDDVLFMDHLPLTATGKLSKLQLRQQLVDYRLPAE